MAGSRTCLVQQLVHQAKLTFCQSKSESPRDLEKLKKIMSQLTAKDFNLNLDTVGRPWDFPPFVKDAPAAFIDANQAMPLHDHPHMFGLMKILIGSMIVTSYNKLKITEGSKPPYLAKFSGSVVATQSSDLCCLHPEEDNIHELQAQDTPVAFLDILAPPYNPSEGRDCTYYSKGPPPSISEVPTHERSVWLMPGKHPQWFSCVPQWAGPRYYGNMQWCILSESLESLQKPSLLEPVEETSLIEKLKEHGDRGDPVAQFSLANVYLKRGMKDEGLLYLCRAVKQGDIQAMYHLGVLKYEGVGMDVCPVCISNGTNAEIIAAAQFNVGRAYFQGFGVKQDTNEAIKWWELCSQSKSLTAVRAMNTLALLYSSAENFDEEKAFTWHVKAAENGHMDSMGTLGLMYMKGQGCKKDKELSLKWLKKSAEIGSIYGTGLLSNYYYSMKMFCKAVDIAKRVCDHTDNNNAIVVSSQSIPSLISEGLATAYYIYAQCLFTGQGSARNTQLSNIFFTKAKELNKTVTAGLHFKMTYGKL